MELDFILESFINFAAQAHYNMNRATRDFERESLEKLFNKIQYLAEEVPGIIFEEFNYTYNDSILTKIRDSYPTNKLCDDIYSFCVDLEEWAIQNNISRIIPLLEEFKNTSNETVLKGSIQYLN